MNIEHLILFPTLVKKFNKFLTEEECKKIVSNLDKFEFNTHPLITGNSSSAHKGYYEAVFVLNTIDKDIFPINDRLFQQITIYGEELGIVNLGINNSWINIQGPGSNLKVHCHPLSAISGALYLKVDNQSSGLMFVHPNPQLDMVKVDTYTAFSSKTVEIKPSIGDLILFPSWLKHGSDITNMSEQRVVLSFNTGFL